MKPLKDRLSDEVYSTGAGNCARINTFAPLGMQICKMCESVTAHFRMGTESYFQFCHLQLQVFWVRDTASMVLQTARRTSPPFVIVIVVLVCSGVAPLPIGCGITYKFPLRSKNKSFKMKATNFRTPIFFAGADFLAAPQKRGAAPSRRTSEAKMAKTARKEGVDMTPLQEARKTTNRLTFGCRFQYIRSHSPLICSASGVSVYGSVTYAELCPLLQEHGFALPNLASLPHISVARQSHLSRRVGMKFCQSRLLEP